MGAGERLTGEVRPRRECPLVDEVFAVLPPPSEKEEGEDAEELVPEREGLAMLV